jgi:hypothetical protein
MARGQYAQNTEVSQMRSLEEIERTLKRYGASEFAYAWNDGKAAVGFHVERWRVKFILPMPRREEFSRTDTGRVRKANQIEAELEKAGRQRWRALALVIKAKLEAVQCGITTFEEEFLAHILVPGTNGMTVAQCALPGLTQAYETGKSVPLLPSPEDL